VLSQRLAGPNKSIRCDNCVCAPSHSWQHWTCFQRLPASALDPSLPFGWAAQPCYSKADIPVGCCGTVASYPKTDGPKHCQPDNGVGDGKPVS
jgi:hypothetical protein